MTEKVLGFKKEEAEVKFKKTMTSSTCCDYLVDGFKLVPVVSVEWLEKECEKQDKWAIAGSALRELYLAALKESRSEVVLNE